MPNPLVTLVTPAYNQAEFLAATIESVLAQDYAELEYFVIDDGSSDDSLAVARRYEAAHPGRLTVFTQANSGQAATLNRGWGMARGEILGYLSSDDCLMPGAVSRMVDALVRNPSASVSYCDFWLIDADGKRLRESRTEEFDLERLRVDLVCQPGPGAFFRRSVFDAVGGWLPDLTFVPDFEFWLRAAEQGGFLRVPEPLAEYRVHEGSGAFRPLTTVRAEEILGVMRAYWDKHPGQSSKAGRSIARASAQAAKNHAQSGRSAKALRCFVLAIRLRPGLLLDLGIWRQLLVGFLRRGWYQLRASTRAA